MTGDIVEFKGTMKTRIYVSENFKVYGIYVNKKDYPKVKLTKYKNVSISGDIPELIEGVEYEIVGIEQMTKCGVGYQVKNIRTASTDINDTLFFLESILTKNQANTLYGTYPDIVQIVKDNRCSEIDFSKLKGITPKKFETIRQKIFDYYCLMGLLNEFQGILSMSIVKKLYNHYTSVDIVKQRIKENPYECLCSVSGIGFKIADGILLDIEKKSKDLIKNKKLPIIDFKYDLLSSVERCSAALIYILKQNEEQGHTKTDVNTLRSECINLISNFVAENFAKALENHQIYYNPDTLEVALKGTYDSEKYVAKNIFKAVNSTHTVWDINTNGYNKINGIELTDEQISILDIVCKNTVSILEGGGGTGKTSSTKAIIDMLEDNKKSYFLLAPTGRAAKVLCEYTGKSTKTIHRGLGFVPPNKWGYGIENKLPYDIIIVDEFSMVDLSLFEHLIDAIDFTKTKLLLIGDSAQIPSVGCGNLLYDFLASSVIPRVKLTRIFRYGEGGLMTVATDTRNAKCYLNKSMCNIATMFGDNKDYMFIDTKPEKTETSIISLYSKLLNMGYAPEDILVLTAKNIGECGTIALNNKLQKIVNKNTGSSKYLKTTCNKIEVRFYVDDMVVMKKNTYNAEIYDPDIESVGLLNEKGNQVSESVLTAFVANGEIGKVKLIEKDYIVVEFDGIAIKIYNDSINNLRLAYSVSIHSSQGGSCKIVILSTPKSHNFMLNSNLLYVGLTRTKEKCYHIGDLNTVNRAVKKKADLNRNTFMTQFLQEHNF